MSPRMRGMIAVLVAVALLALPVGAGAVTFGAKLDQRTANSTATCGYPPYYPGLYQLGSACTFFSTATPAGQSSETQVVPLPDPAVNGNQSGTITAVRIKTGAYQAGPAKLTVLRAHRVFNGGEAACCVGQAESAQFTLTPNSIVNVATDLPVASRYDAAQRIYTYDILALSVLDATTPIPAEFSGNPSGYCSTGYFPYVQTGQERFSGEYSVCGFLVLMQADLTIKPPNEDGDGKDDGGGEGVPMLKLPGRGRIVGRIARIPLDCAGNAICEGILRLQNTAAGQAATAGSKKTKRAVTYGSSSFKIGAGASQAVKVKLSKRGKRLARTRKAVQVYANVTLTGGKVLSKRIRLRP
jgi:hypothetical protein